MTTVRFDSRGPFNHAAALAMLAAHAVPGVEEVDDSTYRRVLPVAGAQSVATIDLDDGGISVTVPATSDGIDALTPLIRRWFDLDTDCTEVDRALARDPLIAPLVALRPGLRLVGHPGEFEAVVATVIGQQVPLAAARTFTGRLVAEYGRNVGHLLAFPDAARLAQADADDIRRCVGLTHARARTLHEVAQRWAAGEVLRGLPGAEARRTLLAVPGIGPWTADILLIRAMHHPDTFVPGDRVVRRALRLDTTAAQERARSWAPYRSYALLHLWTDSVHPWTGSDTSSARAATRADAPLGPGSER